MKKNKNSINKKEVKKKGKEKEPIGLIKKKKNSKRIDLNPVLSIITLSINDKHSKGSNYETEFKKQHENAVYRKHAVNINMNLVLGDF